MGLENGLGKVWRRQRPGPSKEQRRAVRLRRGVRQVGKAGLEHSAGDRVGQACGQKQGQTGLRICGGQAEIETGTGPGSRVYRLTPQPQAGLEV